MKDAQEPKLRGPGKILGTDEVLKKKKFAEKKENAGIDSGGKEVTGGRILSGERAGTKSAQMGQRHSKEKRHRRTLTKSQRGEKRDATRKKSGFQ